MKFALLGYGKMGKMVEKIAKAKGYTINQFIDSPDDQINGSSDVAIIFATIIKLINVWLIERLGAKIGSDLSSQFFRKTI